MLSSGAGVGIGVIAAHQLDIQSFTNDNIIGDNHQGNK
jgi:hypothetical protein